MALNWNLEKIADYKAVCFVTTKEGKQLRGATETLIWHMHICGIGELTAKNAQDAFERIRLYESLFGPLRHDMRVTPDEVTQHIGLWTNGNRETKAAFNKRALARFHQEQPQL